MTIERRGVQVDIDGPVRTVVTQVGKADRQQATDGGQLTLRMQQLYSLALVDTTQSFPNQIVEFPGIDPGGSGKRPKYGGGGNFAEYFFRVPPKVNEMTEPFATTIVPTQNGGKYVESHGSIIKQIRIQGTTGLRPNKKLPQTIPLLGITTEALEDLSPGNALRFNRNQIPENEVTGWDDIIFLRNIFRLYSDLKQDDRLAGRIVMVWRNAKDLDYWVVEPVDFKLTHSSSSPMTYEYVLQFKTLARFDFSIGSIDDPLERMRSTRRFISRLQGYAKNIQRVLASVAAGIDRLDGIGVFAVNTILGPAVSLARGLLAIKESVSKFGSRTYNRAKELFDNLADALVQIANFTEGIFLVDGPSSSPRPDILPRLGFEQRFTLATSEAAGVEQRFPLQDPLVNNLRKLQRTCAHVLAEKTLQDTVSSRSASARDRAVRAYGTGGGTRLTRVLPETGGSSTFLGNISPPNAVVETTVRRGETIRDIAQRMLGDRGRWHDIAILNDLRAPYISNTGGFGILQPGDIILVPTEGPIGVDSAQVNLNNPTDKETEVDDKRFGPVQQAFGRDLRLKSVTVAADVDLTDLVVNNEGDLSTVAGIPNVTQGLRLKFATERGELTVHPFYGSSFPIGSKATPAAFTAFQIDVRNTLRSDPRVSSIEELNLTAVGDVIVVSCRLKLIDSSDILSTDFALRRF